MVRRVVTPLPRWEQTTYWVVGLAAILYGVYNVYLASAELKFQLQYVELGANLLGGRQDVADFEWYIYCTYLCWQLPPLLVVHIALSRAMIQLNVQDKTRKLLYVLVGATSACYLQSWRFTLLIGLTPIPFYLASTLHSLPAVWAVSVTVIYVCNSHVESVTDLLQISDSTDYFVVIYIWASVFLRCTCFSIERVWSLKQVTFSTSAAKRKPSSVIRKPHRSIPADSYRQRTFSSPSCVLKPNGCPVDADSQLYGWPVLTEVPDLCDFFLYIFYVPLLFSGPPVPFMSFLEQTKHPLPLSRDRVVSIVWKSVRVCFWFCFNSVMLHFLYFQAFGQDPEAMQAANKWTLATTAYLTGQFMTNKYVVIYGAMTQTARLDGLELADNPACISYIYVYSDMWKSFDRGLYSCLKRYIYVPLGGSQAGVLRTEVASLATFFFIGYWHGGGHRYMMWSLLNFVEVSLELAGASLERSPLVQRHLTGRLSAPGVRRVKCVLTYPVFLLATTSNMYFLAGRQFAEIYAARVCLQWDSFLTLGLVIYCMSQNSKHLEMLGLTKFT